MRTMFKLGLSCLLCAFMAFVAVGRSPATAILKAKANISGPNGVSGTAVFVQVGSGIIPTVQMLVTVTGLAPGSKHGFHIHENGSCTDTPGPPVVPFGGAGGHFDPGPFGNSGPDINHPYHMGDVPNLVADSNGKAIMLHSTSRITLSPGLLSIFDANGSAVIVHLNDDQNMTGAVGSGLSGGPRIACGIIMPDND